MEGGLDQMNLAMSREMKSVYGRARKVEMPISFKGIAIMFLFLTAITPLAIITINQKQLQSRAMPETNLVLGQKQSAVVRAPSFPPTIQWLYKIPEGFVYTPPVIADLSGNGMFEVVFGASDGNIYCLSALTGNMLWSYKTGGEIDYSPAVADLFGNGKKEVLVGSFDGIVYCFDGLTGGLLWSHKSGDYVGDPIICSPVVADFANGKKVMVAVWDGVYCLDGTTGSKLWSFTPAGSIWHSLDVADVLGNGGKEIIIGSWDYRVYCLDGATGRQLWNYTTQGEISLPAVVDDVNADGKKEVVVGSDDNKTYCLDGKTGSLLWSYTTAVSIYSSPLTADLFGDGKKEVIVRSADAEQEFTKPSKVYCLNGTTGEMLWFHITGPIGNSFPAAADLLGNGKQEVILVSDLTCALDGTGTSKWNYTDNYPFGSSPLIVDLYADGKREVIIGSDGVYCLNGTDGNLIWNRRIGETVQITPVAADFDGDGRPELVFVTYGDFFTNVYCMSYSTHLEPYISCSLLTLLLTVGIIAIVALATVVVVVRIRTPKGHVK